MSTEYLNTLAWGLDKVHEAFALAPKPQPREDEEEDHEEECERFDGINAGEEP